MERSNLHQSAEQSDAGMSRSTPVPQDKSPQVTKAASQTLNAKANGDGNSRKSDAKANGNGKTVGAEATPTARVSPRVEGGPAAGHTGTAGGGGTRTSWGPERLHGALWAQLREECKWDIAEFRVYPGEDDVTACEVSGLHYREGRHRVLSLWDLTIDIVAMDGDGGELYGGEHGDVPGELSAWGHQVYRWAVGAMGPLPPDGDARWCYTTGSYTVPAREADPDHDGGGGDEQNGRQVEVEHHGDSGSDHGQQVEAEVGYYDGDGGHYDDSGGGHGQQVEDDGSGGDDQRVEFEHHDDGGGGHGQQVEFEVEHYDDGGGHYDDGGGGHGQQVEGDGGGGHGQRVEAEVEHHDGGGGGHGRRVKVGHDEDGDGRYDDGRRQVEFEVEHNGDGDGHYDDGGGDRGQQVNKKTTSSRGKPRRNATTDKNARG